MEYYCIYGWKARCKDNGFDFQQKKVALLYVMTDGGSNSGPAQKTSFISYMCQGQENKVA